MLLGGLCAYKSMLLCRAEEGVRPPEAGVASNREPTEERAGVWTQALEKSNLCPWCYTMSGDITLICIIFIYLVCMRVCVCECTPMPCCPSLCVCSGRWCFCVMKAQDIDFIWSVEWFQWPTTGREMPPTPMPVNRTSLFLARPVSFRAETHYVAVAAWTHRDFPASASQIRGSKVCATIARQHNIFFHKEPMPPHTKLQELHFLLEARKQKVLSQVRASGDGCGHTTAVLGNGEHTWLLNEAMWPCVHWTKLKKLEGRSEGPQDSVSGLGTSHACRWQRFLRKLFSGDSYTVQLILEVEWGHML